MACFQSVSLYSIRDVEGGRHANCYRPELQPIHMLTAGSMNRFISVNFSCCTYHYKQPITDRYRHVQYNTHQTSRRHTHKVDFCKRFKGASRAFPQARVMISHGIPEGEAYLSFQTTETLLSGYRTLETFCPVGTVLPDTREIMHHPDTGAVTENGH